ncbi:hypothetical protein DFH09DRAFT_1286694 [Mycena vulgaris]|nr:hypothetical protein DFH09DRAFT_1286694 [Mycena vulgaris]
MPAFGRSRHTAGTRETKRPEFATADWQATIFKIVWEYQRTQPAPRFADVDHECLQVARGINSGASMLGIIKTIGVTLKISRLAVIMRIAMRASQNFRVHTTSICQMWVCPMQMPDPSEGLQYPDRP